jgi:putative phage-type endonuclease
MTTTTDARSQWLAERRTGVGSSDAAVIAGVSPWKSLFALWCEKTGVAEIAPDESEYLEWGHRLEPVIAQKYADDTGRLVQDPGPYNIQRHPSESWCLATLDRVLPGPPLGLLEIKTAANWKQDEWADGDAPLLYLVQVQHQLAVYSTAEYASLAVLFGGQKFRWLDVPRNQPFIDALLAQEHAFWRTVETGVPPPPDASPRTRELLQRLYPRHEPGLVIPLPGEAIGWDENREEALRQIKYWEAEKLQSENMLRGALGTAERGVLPNGTVYSWMAHDRRAYTVEAATIRTLRRQKGRDT